jgi:hypothetical protein
METLHNDTIDLAELLGEMISQRAVEAGEQNPEPVDCQPTGPLNGEQSLTGACPTRDKDPSHPPAKVKVAHLILSEPHQPSLDVCNVIHE